MVSGTKYPILLVHGMGYRDDLRIGYWGRIPGALEAMGCRVFLGNQEANAAVDTNGRKLAERIDEILEETGADKVNIIAHSKGGLDSRYAITVLNMGDKVASLTTLATPHNGSKTVDKLLKLPDWLVRFAALCADGFARLLGDRHPDSYRVFHSFTTAGAAAFNEAVPDREGILYRSYAFVMKGPGSDLLMWLQNLVVRKIEGENDGLLTPEAVRWGEFGGTCRGVGRRGISHCDEVDLRRRPLSRKQGEGLSDVTDLYRAIAADLRERGL